MAKAEIAGIEIDLDAQRKNSPDEQAAIFAHLKGSEKTDAVAELSKLLRPVKVKQEAAKETIPVAFNYQKTEQDKEKVLGQLPEQPAKVEPPKPIVELKKEGE